MKKVFNYNKETGISTCTGYSKSGTFVGKARTCPEDTDMKSERTGLSIAEMRVNIQALKNCIKNDIKPKLEILYHLYDCMSQSQKFQVKSYEAHMVRSQIHCLENQLDTAKQDLADEERFLKEYLATKEKLYKRIRIKREDKID